MTQVGQFNPTVGGAYVTKTVPASAVHRVIATITLPSASLAAILAAANTDSSYLIEVEGNGLGSIDGIFAAHDFGTWQWWTAQTGDPAAGSATGDVPHVLELLATFDSGTTWILDWTADGVLLFTDTLDLGVDNTDPFPVNVGAQGGANPGAVAYVSAVEIRNASSAVVFASTFAVPAFADWDSVTGDAVIGSPGGVPVPSVIGIRSAFGYGTYDPAAQFIRLDDPTVPGLSFDGSAHNVSGYQIDRGRAYELDKTQAGTASLSLFDVSGIFDPTNPDSPLAGLIGPMQQTKLGVQHGWTGLYTDLFTGFLESYKWSMTSDEVLMMLAIGLVDGFEPLSRAEIPPGANGTTIFAATSDVQTRIDALLDIAPWPTAAGWRNINTGNVFVQRTVYNPQTSVLSAIQDAGDADFPGVANFFMRKGGAAAFLGRYPRFKPELFPQDVQFWTCGDKGAVSAFGGATIKNIEWELDNKNLINAALALPFGIAQTDIAGQLVFDAASIAQFGVRSKSLPDLLVDGQPMSTFQPALGANAVCLAYAQYYVSNYSQPAIRISTLEFEVVLGTRDTPSETWDLVLGVEIGDILTVYTSNPGGGGFGKGTGGTESPTPAQFFVEGIHYVAGFVDGVPILKLSLDVSPRGWFLVEPWTV